MESKKHTEKKKMKMSEYIKGKEIRINVEKEEKVERKRQFQEALQRRYKMSMVGKEKVN
jgi:hypothetical protein